MLKPRIDSIKLSNNTQINHPSSNKIANDAKIITESIKHSNAHDRHAPVQQSTLQLPAALIKQFSNHSLNEGNQPLQRSVMVEDNTRFRNELNQIRYFLTITIDNQKWILDSEFDFKVNDTLILQLLTPKTAQGQTEPALVVKLPTTTGEQLKQIANAILQQNKPFSLSSLDSPLSNITLPNRLTTSSEPLDKLTQLFRQSFQTDKSNITTPPLTTTNTHKNSPHASILTSHIPSIDTQNNSYSKTAHPVNHPVELPSKSQLMAIPSLIQNSKIDGKINKALLEKNFIEMFVTPKSNATPQKTLDIQASVSTKHINTANHTINIIMSQLKASGIHQVSMKPPGFAILTTNTAGQLSGIQTLNQTTKAIQSAINHLSTRFNMNNTQVLTLSNHQDNTPVNPILNKPLTETLSTHAQTSSQTANLHTKIPVSNQNTLFFASANTKIIKAALQLNTTPPSVSDIATPHVEARLSQIIQQTNLQLMSTPKGFQSLLQTQLQQAAQKIKSNALLDTQALTYQKHGRFKLPEKTMPVNDQQTLNQQNDLQLQQLKQNSQQVINRLLSGQLQQLQLQNDPNATQNTQQIPFMLNETLHWLQIDEDKQNEDAHIQQKKKQWFYRLFFQLAPLSELCAQIELFDNQLSINFWSENQATLAFLQGEITELHKSIAQKSDFDCMIRCQRGMPKKRQSESPSQFLVDVHT